MSGSRRDRLTDHEQSAVQDTRMMQIALLTLAAYLFLGAVPVLRWGAISHQWAPLLVHIVALALCILFGLGDFSRKLRNIRDWLGVVIVGFMYFELRFIGDAIGMRRKDDDIAALDRTLFRGAPWKSLATRVHSLPISELLHFAYVSYYPLIIVPPILLWRAKKRRAFTVTALTLILAYVICFCVSIMIPVDGPRFVHGPAEAPSGPFRGLALTLLGMFSSRGSAFPSSHVAASVAASYCALRFQRRWLGWVVTALTCGLAIGAVYGGLHYATDIVAGAAVGGVAILVSRLIEKRTAGVQPSGAVKKSKDDSPINVQIMRARLEKHARHSRPLTKNEHVLPDPPPRDRTADRKR